VRRFFGCIRATPAEFDTNSSKCFHKPARVTLNEDGESTQGQDQAVPDAHTGKLEGVLWRLERFMPGGIEVDWKKSRQRNITALAQLASTLPGNQALIERLDGAPYLIGGDEHLLIRLDDEPSRIYKSTYGDSFGCKVRFDDIDPERTGRNFLATLNDDPRYYLKRWVILNSLGGYQTRFEGILPPEKPHWAPRICVSQPWIDGLANPTVGQIENAMKSFGFASVSENAYFEMGSRILLVDAAPRNVRIFQGGPVPFDAIAEIASDEVADWIRAKQHQ
jgi:hypothetical protein